MSRAGLPAELLLSTDDPLIRAIQVQIILHEFIIQSERNRFGFQWEQLNDSVYWLQDRVYALEERYKHLHDRSHGVELEVWLEKCLRKRLESSVKSLTAQLERVTQALSKIENRLNNMDMKVQLWESKN